MNRKPGSDNLVSKVATVLRFIIVIALFSGFYSSASGHHCNKGEICLHLSIPYINGFNLQPEEENDWKVMAGFWGITIGLDYYHSDNQFLNLSASAVTDIFLPFPAAIDFRGETEFMSSVYFSLSNNHKIRKFTLGYGLSFGRNTWDLRYYDDFDPPPPTRDPVTKKSLFLGLVFPGYYNLTDHFHAGIIYRPSFYRPNIEPRSKYEHLISIEIGWKIKL